jgi:hypothetical protein
MTDADEKYPRWLLQDTQRSEAVAELESQALEIATAVQADNWTVTFSAEARDLDGDPLRPEMFARAARVAVALCDTRDFTVSNLSRVTFRPCPSKHEGVWF